MNAERVYHVILALPLGTASGRKILNGVYRFLGEGYSWDVELLRTETNFARLFDEDGIDTREFDGILVAYAESEEMRLKQANINMPSVFVDYPDSIRTKIKRHAFVSDDEESIAETATRHLLSTGTRASFGFVPTRSPSIWSSKRRDAFIDRMKRHGKTASTFPGGDRNALSKWLVSLPKPAGVLAAFDDRALDVLEACRHAAIPVPEEVAVLGIGNDEPICEAAAPPLSSVAIEFASQGYRAARELHALMMGGKPKKRGIRYGATTTVSRASTAGQSPSAAVAARAMQYIKANALHGITTKDVVAHLRVSRRLATLRFREAYRKSILQVIIDERLAEAKRLLEKTELPISDVAAKSGFRDPAAFRAVFIRRCGVNPRKFRNRKKAGSSSLPFYA